jgi:hypothetical protein
MNRPPFAGLVKRARVHRIVDYQVLFGVKGWGEWARDFTDNRPPNGFHPRSPLDLLLWLIRSPLAPTSIGVSGSSSLQQLLEKIYKVTYLVLREKVVCPGVETVLAQMRIDRKNYDGRGSIIFSDLMQNFDPALLRHRDVQHYNVGMEFFNHPQRFRPVFRLPADGQPLDLRENQIQQIPDLISIVGDQHP